MIANELITSLLSPLQITDTGEQALTMMHIYHIKHLPLLDGDKFVSLVSEDDLLVRDMHLPLSHHEFSADSQFVDKHDHLFDLLKKFSEQELTCIAVLDNGKYIGMVTQEDLLQYYASSFSFSEPGGIILLSMHRSNYSLAEISRIIEGENAAILGCLLTMENDNQTVLVSIKVNKLEISNIKASLERFGYEVSGSFTEEEYYDNLKERYEGLMSFLNV